MLNVSCLSFGLKSSLETFIMRSLVYDSLICFPLPHLETLYLGTVWVLYVLLMLLWLWCLYILPYIWNILAWSPSDSVTFWYSSFFFFDEIFSRELLWGPTANSCHSLPCAGWNSPQSRVSLYTLCCVDVFDYCLFEMEGSQWACCCFSWRSLSPT